MTPTDLDARRQLAEAQEKNMTCENLLVVARGAAAELRTQLAAAHAREAGLAEYSERLRGRLERIAEALDIPSAEFVRVIRDCRDLAREALAAPPPETVAEWLAERELDKAARELADAHMEIVYRPALDVRENRSYQRRTAAQLKILAIRAQRAAAKCEDCEGTGHTENGFQDCQPCGGTGKRATGPGSEGR